MCAQILACALFTFVALTASMASAQDAPAPTLSIGVAVPTSGEYAPLGKQLVDAVRLAARETGVQVVVSDTEGEPATAVKAVTELAADPTVIAIVGPVGQRESRAAAATANRLGVPLFSLTTSESVNRSGGWVFRVRNSPGEQAASLAEKAHGRLGAKTAAILYPKTRYGSEAAKGFAEQFIAAGGKVTAVANYPTDTTDYRDVLDVIVAKKVYLGKKGTVGKWRTDASGFARLGSKPKIDFDVLFIPDFHNRIARILPFLPLAGIQNGDGGEGQAVQLLGLSGWQGKTMEFAGGTAAGALYVDTFAGETAGGRAEEFSRTFETATGRRPVDVEAETFDIAWLLGSLSAQIVESGERDAAKLRAEMVRRLPRKDLWNGVAGPLRFGSAGEPIRDLGLYRFDTDGLVIPAE